MIVCIGDSITYGQHLQPGERPWPLLLGDQVHMAGTPGDTTRLGLERFPFDVQTFNPEVVIIQFGHNDCNRWESDRGPNTEEGQLGLPRVSPLAFRANLIEMIDRARAFMCKGDYAQGLFLCTLTPSLRSGQHGHDVSVYDGIVRSVAQAEDTGIIDARGAFYAYPVLQELLMEDGLHLTAKGHEVYAEAVRKALMEGLRK